MPTKKTTEDWEKEFDKDYYRLDWHTPEEIKSFIRTQIQKARKEGYEELKKGIGVTENKWKKEDIEEIRKEARQSEIAKFKKVLEGLRITFDEANKEAIEPDDYMFGLEKCKKEITKALDKLN